MSIDNLFESIKDNAERANRQNAGDYIGEDGLLHCGKCNVAKQTKQIHPFKKTEVILPCMCKCREEELQRQEEERKQIEMLKRIQKNRAVAFPKSSLEQCKFETADGSNEKIMGVAKKYVENFADMREKGKGLLLYGNVGSGKTFISACIANALLDNGYSVMMTNFARIANTVSGMFEGKQEYYDSLNEYSLLVIDDLSAERKTEYMQEIVFNVIDARCRAKKPIIITTNLTRDDMLNPDDTMNKRIFSRVFEMCLPVKVEGIDKRQEKMRNDFAEMKGVLGL